MALLARPRYFALAVPLLGLLLALAGCFETSPPAADTYIHLLMGNPSDATTDAGKADNYLMKKPYFALSYNNTRGTPNWVSWCLQQSDLGNAPREDFFPDPDLPRTFQHVKPGDYSGGGFDRGHMCPHSDRASTPEASKATFVMTNIIPQAPACNQHAWADFEDYCRELVRRKHQTLYIVSGPQGVGGVGRDPETKEFVKRDAIGHAVDVAVPAKCWKVVLALDDGRGDETDVNRVSRETRLIAVVMPNHENDKELRRGWAQFRKSVKEVEELTGYHFFDRVPAEIIGPLKERVDKEHIPAGHHRKSED